MFKYLAYVLGLAVIVVACDDDDFTGDSTLTASSPTISIGSASSSANEGEKITIDVSISEAQIVDIPVYVSVTDGDASLGDDFTIDNTNSRALISAGRTSTSIVISLVADGVAESDETFTIQIGDDRTTGGSLSSATATVTIVDVTEVVAPSETITLGLEWDTEVYDVNSGSELIDPRTVADLRFYIQNADTTIQYIVDGGSFESFVLENNTFIGDTDGDGNNDTLALPDDDYVILTDFFGVEDFGAAADGLGGTFVDLHFTYAQEGVQSGALDYAQAMHTAFVDCQVIHIATITVSGDSYTIEGEGASSPGSFDALPGNYNAGYVFNGFASVFNYATSFRIEDGKFINESLMPPFIDGAEVEFEIDFQTFAVEIPEQRILAELLLTADPDDRLDTLIVNGTGGLVNICDTTFQIQWFVDIVRTEKWGRDGTLTREVVTPFSDFIIQNDVVIYSMN